MPPSDAPLVDQSALHLWRRSAPSARKSGALAATHRQGGVMTTPLQYQESSAEDLQVPAVLAHVVGYGLHIGGAP
jgi:hypothetical protein